MSENVKVPFGGKASDNATLLLSAAEELDLDQSVVRTTSGAFVVPKEVADKAGVDYDSGEDAEQPKKKAAKKTAKKASAKDKE